jgi:protein SCO1
MKTKLLFACLTLLVLYCGPKQPQEVLLPIGEFEMTDDSGQPFRLSSLHGRPALVFFGYTHCPDACPTMLSKLTAAYRKAGEKGKQIPTLFVSVDPRDTPPVLKEYLSYFPVPATGITGPKEQIDVLIRRFGGSYEVVPTESEAGPLINHSLTLYLLDDKGDVVKLFNPSSTPDEVAKAMRAQL